MISEKKIGFFKICFISLTLRRKFSQKVVPLSFNSSKPSFSRETSILTALTAITRPIKDDTKKE